MPAYKAATMWPTAVAVAAATTSNKCLGLGYNYNDFSFIKIAFHFGPRLSYRYVLAFLARFVGFSTTAAAKWPKNFNEI